MTSIDDILELIKEAKEENKHFKNKINSSESYSLYKDKILKEVNGQREKLENDIKNITYSKNKLESKHCVCKVLLLMVIILNVYVIIVVSIK